MTSADKVDQMCMHRPSGRAAQPRLKSDIEPLDDRVDMPNAGGETVQDAGFALAAVLDKGPDVVRGSVIAGPWVGQ